VHQFAIPAFIWMNDAYRAAHPERISALQHNAALEIRSHSLFYSMAEIMGITRPGDEPSESFASGHFSPDVSSPHIAGDHLVELHDTPPAP
jgi:glucan phosphoethanolaminetransferase (alkaline phosphatase superfamily)